MVIMDTNFKMDGNCDKLVNYLNKADSEMMDHRGREMDDDELNEFVRKSRGQEMNRMITFSPVPEAGKAMDDDEMSLHARQTMNEYMKDRPEASYCYSIHRDTDKPHVQVAIAGQRDSVAMYKEHIAELNEIAQSQWRDEKLADQLRDEQTKEKAQSDGVSQSIGRGGV